LTAHGDAATTLSTNRQRMSPPRLLAETGTSHQI